MAQQHCCLGTRRAQRDRQSAGDVAQRAGACSQPDPRRHDRDWAANYSEKPAKP